MDKQLASATPEHVIVERREVNDGRTPTLVIVLRADPVDWYLSRHKATPEVAKAMHEHRYLPGMTDDEMDVAGDGPGQYRVTFKPKLHSGGFAKTVGKREFAGDPLNLSGEQKKTETFPSNSKPVARERAEKLAAIEDAWEVESVERIPSHPVEP